MKCDFFTFQDRPERAIYVPGAARRAQQQKGTTAAKADDKPAEKKPKDDVVERTESPQDSTGTDSEGPSSEKTEQLEEKSLPTEPTETSEDGNKEMVDPETVTVVKNYPEEGTVVEKDSSPDKCEEVKEEVVDEPIPEESVKEDES